LYYDIFVWVIEYFKSRGEWYGFINVVLDTLGICFTLYLIYKKNTFWGNIKKLDLF